MIGLPVVSSAVTFLSGTLQCTRNWATNKPDAYDVIWSARYALGHKKVAHLPILCAAHTHLCDSIVSSSFNQRQLSKMTSLHGSYFDLYLKQNPINFFLIYLVFKFWESWPLNSLMKFERVGVGGHVPCVYWKLERRNKLFLN